MVGNGKSSEIFMEQHLEGETAERGREHYFKKKKKHKLSN